MNLWLRLCWIWFRSRSAKKLSVLEHSKIDLLVCLNDLDVYGHLNNGRYLALMDLGRIDLIWRSPLSKLVSERRWYPLVAGVTIRYRRPLRLFQGFTLITRIASWDSKWIYVEQLFVYQGKAIARAIVRGILRGPEDSIPTAQVLEAMGLDPAMPPPVDPSRFDELLNMSHVDR